MCIVNSKGGGEIYMCKSTVYTMLTFTFLLYPILCVSYRIAFHLSYRENRLHELGFAFIV